MRILLLLLLVFVILWPVETADKNQFYTSQNVVKLIMERCRIFKTFYHGNTPAQPLHGQGKGAGREGREERKSRGRETREINKFLFALPRNATC